jgi:hypothetical protein
LTTLLHGSHDLTGFVDMSSLSLSHRAVASGAGTGLAAAQPVNAAPTDTVRLIRVTTVSGTTMDLYTPRVANDSLYGRTNKKGPESAFALADIRDVKTQEFDAVAAVAGVLVGTALIVGFMALVGSAVCAGGAPC